MKKILIFLISAGVVVATAVWGLYIALNAHSDLSYAQLVESFRNPPIDAKPWCYYGGNGGNIDEDTITRDLESMARLGFGGILFSDIRGYWDNDDHLIMPKPHLEVMSPEWRKVVIHTIKECDRLGLKFAANTATCGGALKGVWPVGGDAPKRLMCRVYAADADFEKPVFEHWTDIAECTVKVSKHDAEKMISRGWYEAGDGTRTQHAHTANSKDEKVWIETLSDEDSDAVDCRVRFGATVIPGHDKDVDVLDPNAIRRHFNRFIGALMDEAGPELVGLDKTFAFIYSVSWEGVVPQWSVNFREDFRRLAGYDIDGFWPELAGFKKPGTDPMKFMRDFRRARNDMFRENFYGTLRTIARERGVGMFSENGGPWRREPEVFLEADQLKTLSLNDMPQGEFWLNEDGTTTEIFGLDDHADRFFTRAIASAAHVYGKKRASAESFTHMTRHWSISPGILRKVIDKAFADGINHVVWHTFTQTQDKFGVPGSVYFAGTHIGRTVTWYEEAGGFLKYLQRCEAMLQAGYPVIDIPVKCGDTPYAGWGRFRDRTSCGVDIPKGYNYDMVNDEEWAKSTIKDGSRIMASGMRYPLELPQKPDLEGPFTFMHRKVGSCDVYFVEGNFDADATFRVTGEKKVELFDAVTGNITKATYSKTDDGRYTLPLNLSETGSIFVVFSDGKNVPELSPENTNVKPLEITGTWDLSFKYHLLTHNRYLPKPIKTDALFDWSLSDDNDIKHFAGTASYRITFNVPQGANYRSLSTGALPTGVARVFVNGIDCGVIWCAPWEIEIPSGILVEGENSLEIRYTNNWTNRLIGDAYLEPEDRVTRSNLQFVKGSRIKANGKTLNPFSGYSSVDPLQKAGLLGPVVLKGAK